MSLGAFPLGLGVRYKLHGPTRGVLYARTAMVEVVKEFKGTHKYCRSLKWHCNLVIE